MFGPSTLKDFCFLMPIGPIPLISLFILEFGLIIVLNFGKTLLLSYYEFFHSFLNKILFDTYYLINNNNISSGVSPMWGLGKGGCIQSLPISRKDRETVSRKPSAQKYLIPNHSNF